jgi:hypothetical protein
VGLFRPHNDEIHGATAIDAPLLKRVARGSRAIFCSSSFLEFSVSTKQVETIHWINASKQLPDAGSEVLVCFERNDCFERDTCIAVFDDSLSDDGSCCWEVDGGLTHFGIVLYWAEKPVGPTRS